MTDWNSFVKAPTVTPAPITPEQIPQAGKPLDAPVDWNKFTVKPPEASSTPEAPAEPSLLSKLNSGITAAGGAVQQGISKAVNQAAGSNVLPMAPPIAQEEMTKNPTISGIGEVAGNSIPAVISASLTAGGGLLASLGSNAAASAILAGPDNRIAGGLLGTAAASVGPIIGNVTNYTRSLATIGTKLKKTMGEITGMIKGDPGEVAVKSQANMWNTADAIDKKLWTEINNATTATTVPINAAARAAEILEASTSPKALGNLTGPQRDIVEKIASWRTTVPSTRPASMVLGADGAPIQGMTKSNELVETSFSLAELHAARKGLDQAISQAFNQAENSGSIAVGIAHDLASLRAPLEADLLNAAKAAGLEKQYLSNNAYYKNTMRPLINTGAKDTAKALQDSAGDPYTATKLIDGLIDKNFKVGKPHTAKAFLDTLDPVGKQAVEVKAVNNILSKATDPTGEVDYLVFKKNSKEFLQNFGDVINPNTKKLLTGLNSSIDEATKILGITLDFSRVGSTSKIYGVLGLGAGATALGAAPVAAGGGVILAGLLKAMNSPVGQKMLIKIGSPGGKALGQSFINGLLVNSALGLAIPNGEDVRQAKKEEAPVNAN